MPYTITREDGALDLGAIRQILSFVPSDKDNYPAWYRLRELADSIEEQVKAVVEEPTEFGSLVRAGRSGSDRVLWHPTTFHGKHYWMSETGVVEVWSELTDVEVLRVGLGEPESVATQISRMSRFAHEADKDAFDAGFDACRAGAHQKLCALLADAITSERKNAFEKAIQAVEELAP